MAAARSVGAVRRAVIAFVALVTSGACSSGEGTVETAAVTSTSVERPTTTTTPISTSTTRRMSATTSTTRRRQSTTTTAQHVNDGQAVPEGAPTDRGDDPLGRRDVPVEGVPGLLTFALPTDGPRSCALGGAGPVVSSTPETIPIGGSAIICIAGFDASPAVSVEVAVPQGETKLFSVQGPKPDDGLRFPVGVSDPSGTYRITAVQGAKRATAAMSVVLPDRTLVMTLDPKRGPSGTVFRFTMVTAAPNQTVVMDLYRGPPRRSEFATTLGSVTTNSQGRATYRVPTTTASPAGDYCLVARPFHGRGCAAFTVT